MFSSDLFKLYLYTVLDLFIGLVGSQPEPGQKLVHNPMLCEADIFTEPVLPVLCDKLSLLASGRSFIFTLRVTPE